MNPIARRTDVVARPLDDGLVILGQGHMVHQLDAVSAYVWSHADGNRDVEALAAGLRETLRSDADTELVFSTLDRLADAGLLERRAAPPSGISRRSMLRRLTGGAALVALTTVVGVPDDVLAKGGKGGGACGDEKALLKELAWLEAEESGVADVLEDWVADAEHNGTVASWAVDDVYIIELRKSEVVRKKSAFALAEKSADAKMDLSECKSQKAGLNMERRKKRRVSHFKLRHERNAKHTQRALERVKKRQKKHSLKEVHSKQKLSNKEKHFKKKLKNKPGLLEKRNSAHEKKSKRELRRNTVRLKNQELRIKAIKVRSESRTKHLNVRQERALKTNNKRLVSAKERADVFAQAYASKQSAKASSAAGVKDRIYELAQEEALKAKATANEVTVKKKALLATEQKKKQAVGEQQTKQAKQAAELSSKKKQAAEATSKKKQAAEKYSKQQAAATENKSKQQQNAQFPGK